MASCCVCLTELPDSTHCRRILSPVNPSNVQARTFFLNFVCPNFHFVGEVSYACQTCFKKLEKAARLHATLLSILSDLHQACQAVRGNGHGSSDTCDARWAPHFASNEASLRSMITPPSASTPLLASTSLLASVPPQLARAPLPQLAPASLPQLVPAPLPQLVPAPPPQLAPVPLPQLVPAPPPQSTPAPLPQLAPAPLPQSAPAPRPPQSAAVPLPQLAPVSLPQSSPAPPPPQLAQAPQSAPAPPPPPTIASPASKRCLSPCETPVSKRRKETPKTTTPSSVLKVSHMRGKKILRKYSIHSPYKGVVKTMRYGRPKYTARHILKSPSLSDATVIEIKCIIGHECELLCKKTQSSYLRVLDIKDLCEFKWKSLIEQLQSTAPVLTSVISAAATRSSTENKSSMVAICVVAALLLKHRCKHMCKIQMIVSALLYAGHAAKRVFTRLHKMGLCLSYTATITAVKRMGIDHDKVILDWTRNLTCSSSTEACSSSAEEVDMDRDCFSCDDHVDNADDNESDVDIVPDASKECALPTDRAIIIIGDNWDKNVKPRNMRINNQVKSLHYFHSIATVSRVETLHLNDSQSLGNVREIPISDFLPTSEDCKAICDNYVTLVARVITENFEHFSSLRDCVPNHIPHEHSAKMTQKTTTIPLGVIPKNENNREEIIEILQEIQKYVPKSQDGTYKTLMLLGDQLTVERARAAQRARVASDTNEDALNGLEPAAADWHAEANFLQSIFSRLYKPGTSFQHGTLLQLRNLINRRNVSKDTSGKFNESLDFFQLVVECHIMAAAMHFFSMSTLKDRPSTNAIPLMKGKKSFEKWLVFKSLLTKLVHRYVLVSKVSDLTTPPVPSTTASQCNPHANRIATEHNYPMTHQRRVASEHHYARKPEKRKPEKRSLPQWLQSSADEVTTPHEVQKTSPDGIFNYASAILNDGLLLMELRDAIHEGDGPRIVRCWKFMLLHWKHAGHKKYAYEVIELISSIKAASSPRIAYELVWCRVVNTRGGAGNNIPADLFLEHLNRTLKDFVKSVGANVTSSTVVQASKSLKCLFNIGTHFDLICGVNPVSLHHTKASAKDDRDKILKQLVSDSQVFDYIPGRYHKTFKNIHPHISSHIDATELIAWIKRTRNNIANRHELRKIFQKK